MLGQFFLAQVCLCLGVLKMEIDRIRNVDEKISHATSFRSGVLVLFLSHYILINDLIALSFKTPYH